MEADVLSPPTASAFKRLPPNVIESILYIVDADAFASLVLLNRQWRQISESPSLYAHHLARCQSYAWTKGTVPNFGEAADLASLKRQFIGEVRRNAFDVLLRPRQTLVRLISSSMSSSTAFPQGEVFRFAFSAKGQTLLCITSSRIVVLDAAADPVAVKHELQTRRRPTGAAIVDDGSLLAVLSSVHRVNIYRLSKNEARHIQTIMLNDAPLGLTFSPSGSVLALSFEDSIEVHAIGEQTQPTERRAARCLPVSSLSFSSDGTMLLGSPVDCAIDGVVTITAPFSTETAIDASLEEVQMRMWTTQILFGEATSGFTLACLIGGHEEADNNWMLAYDSQLMAFRATRINNVNAGSIYLASPFLAEETRERLPIMLPSTDEPGELAALGFQDSEVWIYGIPKRLQVASSDRGSGSHETVRNGVGGSHHHDGHSAPRDNLAQLQKIVQQPAFLIRGRRVAQMHGMTAVHWVTSSTPKLSRRRLVAVAPGGVQPQTFGGEDVPVDGGRVLLLDFERSITNGEITEVDIEVGEATPILLVEPDSSLDTEVELERRRTRLRRPDTDSALANRASRPLPRGSQRPNRTLPHFRHSVAIPTLVGPVDRDAAPEVPYDNRQPRSGETLHRAATTAAPTRYRRNMQHPDSPSRRHITPHSDADSWISPPPAYSRESNIPLPEHLRQSLLPRAPATTQIQSGAPDQPVQRAHTSCAARPTSPDQPRPQSVVLQRLGSITTPRRARRNRQSLLATEATASFEHANGATRNMSPDHQVSQQTAVAGQIPPPNHLPVQSIVPDATNHLSPAHPHPMAAVRSAEQSLQQNPMPIASIGAAVLGDDYLSYSVSSPNLLHIPQPHGNALDVTEEDEAQIPERQRSFRRRVSTEPTNLPPPKNEEWRRRIEDWNEHTIQERSRKRRNKCIMM